MSALPMDPKAIDRLGALCGMLGSAHHGERANAAEAAKLLHRYGLTWRELVDRAFRLIEEDPPDFQAAIRECLACSRITDWERLFLEDIAREYWRAEDLSDKQAAIIDRILAKVRRARR